MCKSDERVFWRGELRKALQSQNCKYPVVQAILAAYDKASLTQSPDYAFAMCLYDFPDDEVTEHFNEAKASLAAILEDELRRRLDGHKVSGRKTRKWAITKLEYDTTNPEPSKTLEKVWTKQEQTKDLNHRLAQSKASVSAKARSLDIVILL